MPFRVRALPPAMPLPRGAAALLAAVLAGALLYFVAGPLAFAGLGAQGVATEPPEESPAKAALAAALFDLEHDFETGKLSPDDRDRLRDDLRREALTALARERGQLETASVAAPSSRACVCGRVFGADDRFCASCGKPL